MALESYCFLNLVKQNINHNSDHALRNIEQHQSFLMKIKILDKTER